MYNVRIGCETCYISFSHNMVGKLVLISLQQWSNIQRSQQTLKFVHNGYTA